ncbi:MULTISPECIES: SPOR domain-containing protein [Fictibacillus]|uniref:SPOR domain-containing protein n=1 Tax=Fictibacillus TaxID=1329200 RepID=UPI0011A3ECB4|nr:MULTISPECIES: SPOR domain-containing protein [Fictibacillus]MBH0170754.1 SPOR domain-containing protein [Fictibacillus sp. 18YEL24]
MKQEISILINGKETNYSEDQTPVNEQPVHNDEVAAAIEEVNRGGYTILATSLKKRENFFKRKNGHVINKRTSFLVPNSGKGFPKQIVAAIMGAIVTGTILGILVLTVFSSDITEAGDKVTETSAVATEKIADSSKSVTIRPIKLDFSALQAGVFSSKDRAESVVKSIEEKGFSAVVFKSEEKYSVIVGIGNEKHQLDKFNEAYQKEMDKPLFKSLSFSFDQLKTPTKLDETYFTNGQILLQNTLTLSQMPEASGSGLDRTLSDFNKWKEYGKGQKGKWSESTTKAASDFEKQLEGAFLALKDSKKGELNWAFQQKVMDSLQSYTKLLETLK